jgi:hypothetical protein
MPRSAVVTARAATADLVPSGGLTAAIDPDVSTANSTRPRRCACS